MNPLAGQGPGSYQPGAKRSVAPGIAVVLMSQAIGLRHNFGHWKMRITFGLRKTPDGKGYGESWFGRILMKAKTRIIWNTLLLCVLFLTALMLGQVRAGDTQSATSPSIYDESADGSKQVAYALVHAKKDGKHVLLQFGANWCGWCHKLHNLFDNDKSIAEELKSHFVVVMIDVNKGHNKEVDAKYGNPTRFGLPAIVILDSGGKQLTTEDSGKLEEGDHHDPKKVMEFLKQWAPKE